MFSNKGIGREIVSFDGNRFSFNGMEKVDEINGSGNALDFGARIYDSGLGRLLSLDPWVKKFPSFSPYNFAGNIPIRLVDFNGKGPIDPRTWERKNSLIQLTKDQIIVYAVWQNLPTEFPVNRDKPDYRFDAGLLSVALSIGTYKECSDLNDLAGGITGLFDTDDSPLGFVKPPINRKGNPDSRGGATYQVGGYLALKDAAIEGNYDYSEQYENTLLLTMVQDGVIKKIEKYTNLTWSGDYMLQSTSTFDIQYYSESSTIQKDGKTFEVKTTYAQVTETTTYANRSSKETKSYNHQINTETKEVKPEGN